MEKVQYMCGQRATVDALTLTAVLQMATFRVSTPLPLAQLQVTENRPSTTRGALQRLPLCLSPTLSPTSVWLVTTLTLLQNSCGWLDVCTVGKASKKDNFPLNR